MNVSIAPFNFIFFQNEVSYFRDYEIYAIFLLQSDTKNLERFIELLKVSISILNRPLKIGYSQQELSSYHLQSDLHEYDAKD